MVFEYFAPLLAHHFWHALLPEDVDLFQLDPFVLLIDKITFSNLTFSTNFDMFFL